MNVNIKGSRTQGDPAEAAEYKHCQQAYRETAWRW